MSHPGLLLFVPPAAGRLTYKEPLVKFLPWGQVNQNVVIYNGKGLHQLLTFVGIRPRFIEIMTCEGIFDHLIVESGEVGQIAIAA